MVTDGYLWSFNDTIYMVIYGLQDSWLVLITFDEPYLWFLWGIMFVVIMVNHVYDNLLWDLTFFIMVNC